MSKPTSFTRRLDLFRFLKQTHASSLYSHSHTAQTKCQIYVLGNPSADLDSIISAIIYSYFATRVISASPASVTSPSEREGGENILRQYIPLIDLPNVHAGKELARLRPEFVTALRLAVGWDGGRVNNGNEYHAENSLENSVLTVADLKERLVALDRNTAAGSGRGKETEAPNTRNYEEAASKSSNHNADGQKNLNIMMVDWNALPKLPPKREKRGIEGLSDALPGLKISVVGCIDHHDDECFVSRESDSHPYDPRCIQTGVGSCTSLVVRELRAQGLWRDDVSCSSDPTTTTTMDADTREDQTAIYEAQAARLAMAAILIDTANMTAKSKVSAVDTAVVAFLEAKIRAGIKAHFRSNPQFATSGANWDRQSFYDAIALVKENSVENLTVQEVLGRDYKEWTETVTTKTTSSGTNSNTTMKLGICCMVKPLSWLVEKCIRESKDVATTPTDTRSTTLLFKYLSSFAAEKHLDLVAVMTAFRTPAPKSEFYRELLLYSLNSECLPGVESFEAAAAGELGLEEGVWIGDFALTSATGDNNGCYKRVWKQIDVSKSRKQVAPLLRGALCGSAD
ncbi:hypothetical protein EMCG_03843 [[Emmonsia] crescens]|uniref:DHHA2 domain-containing protein n=1 Tax=[Emmonsia] crescens TaxID=73230 RepID=A0A0G2HUC3_9EURO|nr:hypothetical protein EMCG_03843 [Emmonsia crescens UAMH 3008]